MVARTVALGGLRNKLFYERFWFGFVLLVLLHRLLVHLLWLLYLLQGALQRCSAFISQRCTAEGSRATQGAADARIANISLVTDKPPRETPRDTARNLPKRKIQFDTNWGNLSTRDVLYDGGGLFNLFFVGPEQDASISGYGV